MAKFQQKWRNLIVLARTMSMVNSEERKICMTLQVGEYCNSKFESDLWCFHCNNTKLALYRTCMIYSFDTLDWQMGIGIGVLVDDVFRASDGACAMTWLRNMFDLEREDQEVLHSLAQPASRQRIMLSCVDPLSCFWVAVPVLLAQHLKFPCHSRSIACPYSWGYLSVLLE